MRYRRPAIGLAVFLTVAVAATWLVLVTLRRDVSGPTSSYSALFTDVSGLHPGDDVRVAGVRVGRVETIGLRGNLAEVGFRIQQDQILYRDTIASITYQNIIGQRYLGLSPGPRVEHTPLPEHTQIPVERTEPSFDISYLVNGFEPLFTLLSPEQADNLTSGIVAALQGDQGSVLTLISQTSSLSEQFTGPDDILGQLIGNLNDVLSDLARHSTTMRTVVERTRDIMVGLGSRRAELSAEVGSVNTTLGRLSAIIDNTYPDLSALIDRQPGFSAEITGEGRQHIAYFGANLPYVLKGLARVTQEGSYANAYACNINSTIFAFLGRLIPSVVEHATPGGAIQQSPICR